jgi:hypothetical protein
VTKEEANQNVDAVDQPFGAGIELLMIRTTNYTQTSFTGTAFCMSTLHKRTRLTQKEQCTDSSMLFQEQNYSSILHSDPFCLSFDSDGITEDGLCAPKSMNERQNPSTMDISQ